MDIREAVKPAGTTPPRTLSVPPEPDVPDPAPQFTPTGEGVGEGVGEGDLRAEFLMKQYLDFLESHEVRRDDLLSMLDAIISAGGVTWEFKLFDRVPVRFRMRLAWMDDLVLKHLDAEARDADLSVARYNTLLGACNLAASLSQYGDTSLNMDQEGDFPTALAFVRRLPAAVRNALVSHLAVFDRAVAVATSDWAIKNFIAPRKAE